MKSFSSWFYWDKVSLCSPGTHYGDQDGLELTEIPLPLTLLLGLKACTTILSSQKNKKQTNKKPFTSNRTSEPGNGTMTKAIPYTNGWPAQCASWVTLGLPQLIGTAMFFTLAQTMKLCPKLPGYEFLLFVPSLFPRLQKVLVCK